MATKPDVKPPVPTRIESSALVDTCVRIQVVRALNKTGGIYSHCDWHVRHHVKVMRDQVFGENNVFTNDYLRT